MEASVALMSPELDPSGILHDFFMSSTWTPLHDVSRQGCESTLLVPRSCGEINVSAFSAEIFADSQVSPRRKNVHIPDKDLRVSILSKRRKPKKICERRENTKSKISRWRCRNCPKRPSSDIFEECFRTLENTAM